MYHTIDDFLNDWKSESESTLKLYQNLTDESLTKKLHPNVRSLGYLSWHLIHTMQEMLEKTGLKINIREQQDYNGESVKELCELYKQGAESVAESVKASWSDQELEKEDNLYGEMWKRGMTLTTLIRHQIHHRGEMLVLMRLLGLPVIGIYGPTKEEWALMGMEAMK
jgi:uncharacterized damage-inducible protein DinB